MRHTYFRVRDQANRLLNDPDCRAKRYFDHVILLLIVVSVGLLAAEFLWWPDSDSPAWLATIDHAILVVFLIEYLGRLWVIQPELPKAMTISWRQRVFYHLAARVSWAIQPINLIDLVAILPLFPFLRALRVLRLLRLFTHAAVTRRLFKYFDPFEATGQTLRQNQLVLLFVGSIVGMAIFLGAATGYIAEHRVNPAFKYPFDALYWSVVTISTVGYGDKVPITSGGKIIAMALMLGGFCLFALIAGVLSQTFVHTLLNIREEGIRMTAMVNQIVICGWNGHSLLLLHEIREQSPDAARRVVVFADMPPPEHLPDWVTFVKGDPTQEVELAKVKLSVASSVIVVAHDKEGTSFSDADARTLLTVYTVRAYEAKLAKRGLERNQPLHLTSELLDPDNLEFFQAAGSDEIIQTARFGSTLLARAAVTPQSGSLFHDLLSQQGGIFQRREALAPADSPIAFADLSDLLKLRDDVLAVGLERAGKRILNPAADFQVLPGDILLVMAASIGPTGIRGEATQSFWGPLERR